MELSESLEQHHKMIECSHPHSLCSKTEGRSSFAESEVYPPQTFRNLDKSFISPTSFPQVLSVESAHANKTFRAAQGNEMQTPQWVGTVLSRDFTSCFLCHRNRHTVAQSKHEKGHM